MPWHWFLCHSPEGAQDKGEGGDRTKIMGLANKITIVRILLVPFLLASLFYYKPEYDILRFIALAIFFICAFTDAVDGYVARRFYQKTELGKILDPLADKLLILTAFLCLSVLRHIPPASRIPSWLTIIVLSRDSIILLGSAIIFIILKNIDVRPSSAGKVTTFFQMSTVVASLLQFRFIYLFWYLTAFFTVLSCFNYIWLGSKVLNEPH
jgi:cardiolipin synthase (CMP-forming)